MSATDPVRTVWDALATHGCAPHGEPYDFRARCPGHDGVTRDALHVSIGADGRAVLWCFAHQCSIERIVDALELDVRDLFPAGHRRAHRRHLHEARRSDFSGNARTVANVLLALEQLGADWAVEVRTDCAHCGSPRALLHVSSHSAFLSCPSDEYAREVGHVACSLHQFQQALAGRIEDRRRAA